MKKFFCLFISFLIIFFSFIQFKPIYADNVTIYYHNYYYDKTDVYSRSYGTQLFYGLDTPDPASYYVDDETYNFIGWYRDEELTESISSAYSSDFTNNELHVYGKWAKCVALYGKLTVKDVDNYNFENSGSFYFKDVETSLQYQFEYLNADGTYKVYIPANTNIKLCLPYNTTLIELCDLSVEVGNNDLSNVDFLLTQTYFSTTPFNKLYEGMIMPPNFVLQSPYDGNSYTFIFGEKNVNFNSNDYNDLYFPSAFGVENDKIIEIASIEGNTITFEAKDYDYYTPIDLEKGLLLKDGDLIYFDTNITYRVFPDIVNFDDFNINNTGKYISSTQNNNPTLIKIHKNCFIGQKKIEDDGWGNYLYFFVVVEHENVAGTYFWNGKYTRCSALEDIDKEGVDYVAFESVDTSFIETTPATNFKNAKGYYNAVFSNTDYFVSQNSETIEKPDTIIPFEITSSDFTLQDDVDWYDIETTGTNLNDAKLSITVNGKTIYNTTDYNPYIVNGRLKIELCKREIDFNTGDNILEITYSNKDCTITYTDQLTITKNHSHTINENDIEYIWNEDNSSCTAKVNCTTPGEEHVIEETVNTEYIIIQDRNNVEDGSAKYVANFETYPFTTQEKQIKLDALGFIIYSDDLVYRQDNKEMLIKTNAILGETERISNARIWLFNIGNYKKAQFTENVDYYFEAVFNDETGYNTLNIHFYPSFFEKIEPGVYASTFNYAYGIKGTSTSMNSSFSLTLTVTHKNYLESDLYISKDENNISYYSFGYHFGPDIDNLLVEYKNNSYTITLQDDVTLKSKDIPVIKTNSRSNLTINSDHILNLEKTITSLTDESYVIDIGNSIAFDHKTSNGKFTINYNESNYDFRDTAKNALNSSFINSKSTINLNYTEINCTNYFTCFKTNNSTVSINNNSVVNHNLIPSVDSNIFSCKTGSFNLRQNSIYNAKLNTPSYSQNNNVTFNGVNLASASINNGSSFVFSGNPYNKDFSYGIYMSTEKRGIISTYNRLENPNMINITNTDIGIFTYRITLSDTCTNIISKYCAILTIDRIYFENYEKTLEQFLLQVTSNEPYEHPEYGTLRAIKSVNGSYSFENRLEGYSYKGSLDNYKYYDFESSENKESFTKVVFNNIPTFDESDLVIHNGDNTLMYKGYDYYGELNLPDDGGYINVTFDTLTNTYILDIEGDVSLNVYNDFCIYTNHNYNLFINGLSDSNTLTINANNVFEDVSEYSGIKSDGDLTFNRYNKNLTYYFNDNRYENNNINDIPFHAIQANGNINVKNTTISANNFGHLIKNISYQITYIKEGSSLIHHAYDLNSQFVINDIVSRGDIDINSSSLISDLLHKLDNSTQSKNGLSTQASIYLYKATLNISSNIDAPYDNFGIVSSSSEVSNDVIKIEDSKLTIKGQKAAIDAEGSTITIINSDLDLEAASACLSSFKQINIKITDNKYLDKFKLHRNTPESLIGAGDIFPIICRLNSSNNIYDILNLELPENYDLLFSNMNSNFEEYNIENRNDYNYAIIKFNPIPDMYIYDGSNKALFYEGLQFEGDPITNLSTSYYNNEYIITLNGDVELNPINTNGIVTKDDVSLKIIGENNLDINITANENLSNELYGIISGKDLQIGEPNNTNGPNIYINDIYSINNDTCKPIKTFVSSLKSIGDMYIYNSSIFGDVSSYLINSNGLLYSFNSNLIHNIYANYAPSNRASGTNDIVSIYTNDHINLINNSKLTTSFVPNDTYPNIGYVGIYSIGPNSNITVDNSYISINYILDFEDENIELDKTSIAVLSFADVNIKNGSTFNANNIGSAIVCHNFSLSNSNYNTNTYIYSILSGDTIKINLSAEKSFVLNTYAKGDIDFVNVFPAILTDSQVYDPNKIIISIPDGYTLNNNSFNIINILDYSSLELIKKKANPAPDPVIPPVHPYDVPKTGV